MTSDIGPHRAKSTAPEAGQPRVTMDVTPELKLGGSVESASSPIKRKVRKRRIVKIALHKFLGLGDLSIQISPYHMPAAAELIDYLNDRFVLQVSISSGHEILIDGLGAQPEFEHRRNRLAPPVAQIARAGGRVRGGAEILTTYHSVAHFG
jgi:hypothetical protein